MKDFSDTEAIKKIDPQDTVSSTELLIKQCETAWNEVSKLRVSSDFHQNISGIVLCGMGASIYGGLVLKALEGRQLPYPIEIVTDYHLPNYADKNTLIILTSYSGSTEEVLSCADEAKAKGCKIIVLTKGGKLADFAKENNAPSYIFDGKMNPSGVPRLGNGYTIVGLLGLLAKTGVVSIEEHEIENAIARMAEKLPELKKSAMQQAELFFDRIPVIFAAEHLTGNAHILQNQFNETSKTFSSHFLVPDLNHHLMEGLQFPSDFPIRFIMLNSKNYSPKIQKRMTLTMDVVKQNKRDIIEFTTSGQTVYDDFLETMVFGGFLTLYLALLHDQNPAVNPWVDYFKQHLVLP